MQRARVQLSRSESGSLLRRLVLDTRDGVAALEYGFSAGGRAELADEVNAWLEGQGGTGR